MSEGLRGVEMIIRDRPVLWISIHFVCSFEMSGLRKNIGK